mmetsp:Transcript_21061/g.67854  ORF Transcript_21061/g.67854 Transcript_21061/m.67854 type:complete len:288 (-) Transcript_21061:1510-2373(-)
MCLLLGLVLLWALAMADECGDGRYPVSKVDSVLRGLAEKVVPLATGTDLRRCVTLLPAGTGTESLTEGLRRQFNETRRNWAHSHDHRVSTKDPCYVMTLRDPSKRFESGWRHPTRAPTTRRKMQGDDANAFVDRFRRGKSKGGLLRRWYLDNVRYREHRGHGWFRFWTAQTDYLSGLTADQQIAFVCLENFAHDWANLIGNSGENGGEKKWQRARPPGGHSAQPRAPGVDARCESEYLVGRQCRLRPELPLSLGHAPPRPHLQRRRLPGGRNHHHLMNEGRNSIFGF